MAHGHAHGDAAASIAAGIAMADAAAAGKTVVPVAVTVPDKVFTLEELRQNDGATESTPVYICLKGVVFDVTGSAFYAKGGSYHLLAGRDGSRSLALMKLEPEYVDNPSLDGVDEKDLQTLYEWFNKFASKYKPIGKLVSKSGL